MPYLQNNKHFKHPSQDQTAESSSNVESIFDTSIDYQNSALAIKTPAGCTVKRSNLGLFTNVPEFKKVNRQTLDNHDMFPSHLCSEDGISVDGTFGSKPTKAKVSEGLWADGVDYDQSELLQYLSRPNPTQQDCYSKVMGDERGKMCGESNREILVVGQKSRSPMKQTSTEFKYTFQEGNNSEFVSKEKNYVI